MGPWTYEGCQVVPRPHDPGLGRCRQDLWGPGVVSGSGRWGRPGTMVRDGSGHYWFSVQVSMEDVSQWT